MPKALVLQAGDKFNYFTYNGNYKWVKEKKEKYIECICICGKIKFYTVREIVKGRTRSCGCKRGEFMRKALIKHGLSGSLFNNGRKHPLYSTWDGIKGRCYNKNHTYFKNYGNKGIVMCDEWRDDFKIFYEWAINNGWEKGLTLDRYPNKKGNYEPTNCRWANHKQKNNNKIDNIIITAFGESKTIPDWLADEKCLVGYDCLYYRIKKGWPPEKAITKHGQRKSKN